MNKHNIKISTQDGQGIIISNGKTDTIKVGM